MIGRNVQAGRNIAFLKTQSAAQHAATGGFHNRSIHRRVTQYHLRRHRTGHITRHAEFAVDIHTIRRSQPDGTSRHLEYVRKHARRRRLAVGPRHGRDRYATRAVGREQHVDNRTCNITRRTFARRDMHAETRSCVDLTYAAAGLSIGFSDVFRQEIDATNIETDCLYRADGHLTIVRMDNVRYIDRRATC